MSDEYRDFDREECPFCDGTGFGDLDEDEDILDDGDGECPDCEGTGWLPL